MVLQDAIIVLKKLSHRLALSYKAAPAAMEHHISLVWHTPTEVTGPTPFASLVWSTDHRARLAMSQESRTPTDAKIIGMLAKHARLDLSTERATALAPALDGVLQLLDSFDQVELGETAPAFAYRAKWEG